MNLIDILTINTILILITITRLASITKDILFVVNNLNFVYIK